MAVQNLQSSGCRLRAIQPRAARIDQSHPHVPPPLATQADSNCWQRLTSRQASWNCSPLLTADRPRQPQLTASHLWRGLWVAQLHGEVGLVTGRLHYEQLPPSQIHSQGSGPLPLTVVVALTHDFGTTRSQSLLLVVILNFVVPDRSPAPSKSIQPARDPGSPPHLPIKQM